MLRFRIRPPASTWGRRIAPVERVVEVAPGAALIIGRVEGLELTLPFPTVSGHHARIVCAGSAFTIMDLGSANGTRCNGKRLTPRAPSPLQPGDTFQVADVEVVFEGPAAASAPRAEGTGTIARRLVADLFGACRPAEVAKLVVESGPGAELTLALTGMGRRYIVGRGPSCDLTLADNDVSREHAAVERRWDGVFVSDLDSKNGVSLAGVRLTEARRARDGDLLVIGASRLRVEDPEDRYLQEVARQDDARSVPDEPLLEDEISVPADTPVSSASEIILAAADVGPVRESRRQGRAPFLAIATAVLALTAVVAVVVWLAMASG